jgi:hypothetical protein
VAFSQASEGSKVSQVLLKCFSIFSSVFSSVRVSQEGFSQASEGSKQVLQITQIRVSKNFKKQLKEGFQRRVDGF